VSNKTREDLLTIMKLPEDRVRVVHNGYELADLRGAEQPASIPFPYLLFVGPRGEYKNFRLLLAAFGVSARIKTSLGLVCFGGPPLTSRERQELTAAGLDGRNFRHLAGDDAVLAGCYRAATALVMPSLYEGFGIPALEAMSFGCPVLCSTSGALPEVAGKATIYFDPRSVDACKSALESVFDDSELRLTLQQRGYERISHFGWQKCASETSSAYAALC
jgi:glycosyltransferase involved in cell wall biosynthesis